MFRILTLQQCGEGIRRYLPPDGYEQITFAAIEEAAQRLLDNYGQGIITTPEGELVTHVS